MSDELKKGPAKNKSENKPIFKKAVGSFFRILALLVVVGFCGLWFFIKSAAFNEFLRQEITRIAFDTAGATGHFESAKVTFSSEEILETLIKETG